MTPSGAAKFGEFLGKNDISKRQAGRDLGVSAPTILDWLAGRKTPERQNRSAIQVYTRGEVAEADWETEAERADAERAAGVKPFEPKDVAPEKDPAA